MAFRSLFVQVTESSFQLIGVAVIEFYSSLNPPHQNTSRYRIFRVSWNVAFWWLCWPILAYLGLYVGSFWPILAQVAQLGPNLAQHCFKFGPTWLNLASTWLQFDSQDSPKLWFSYRKMIVLVFFIIFIIIPY